MLRPALLLLLAQLTRTAIVDPPTLTDRLNQLYEKLEKFSPETDRDTNVIKSHDLITDRLTKAYEKLDSLSPETSEMLNDKFENSYGKLERPQSEGGIDRLYEKLDRLNSLTPDKYLTDDEEELVDAMQEWGLLDDQIAVVVKDLQKKPDVEEYGDLNDEDLQDLTDDDYVMDGGEDMDTEEEEGTTPRVTPSALNRLDPSTAGNKVVTSVLSAADPIAATKERPKILDDSSMSKQERVMLRRAAISNMRAVVDNSKCLAPQPRWYSVQQLAPAADTIYMPPCVQLHRCMPDSGCCISESEVCAPVEGQYVNIAYYLNKVDSTPTLARIQFFNHTRCECVSQETLTTTRVRAPAREVQDTPSQDSTRSPMIISRESSGNARMSDWSTQAPRLENETTAPPELRRCTCPTLFLARISETNCSCVCEWAESMRRRDCLSLSRGREHFGLKDRVCVANGDCHPPSCEYGAYEKNQGRCPLRRYRRQRFSSRRYYLNRRAS